MSNNTQHAFEDEVFFNLRKQRNSWMKTALISMAIAFLCLLCVTIMLPFDETRPFVVMVDKTTGEAEKIVEVAPATLQERDAVIQAEIVGYITDRETYHIADNKTRITSVLKRSSGGAADSLTKTWSSRSSNYPPKFYGEDVRIRVVVNSISINPGTVGKAKMKTANVRITKYREQSGYDRVARNYVGTIGYIFQPNQQASLQSVWSNPLGFKVLEYRLDAETLTRREADRSTTLKPGEETENSE